MANYATLKAAIQAVVKTNGNNEITGALLQQSLLAMITSLGDGYQFIGVADISTNPGTPDQNVFYVAGPGTYPNFSNAVVQDGYLGVFKYNGTWLIESVKVGDANSVKYTQQTLTEEEKGQARTNIGAASVDALNTIGNNLEKEIAALNSAPTTTEITTRSIYAERTGIFLTANHTYLVSCYCPTANSATTSQDGLYYDLDGTVTIAYRAGKAQFNAGFTTKLTPTVDCRLAVRTHSANDVVTTTVYDITTYRLKANMDETLEADIINSILSDAFTYSQMQYSGGKLTSAILRWFNGESGYMDITYNERGDIDYIMYGYGSRGYERAIYKYQINYNSAGQLLSTSVTKQ